MRKPQSVPRLPHKPSLLTPSSRQEAIDSIAEPNPNTGARTGLFNLQVSRKGEFEHDERASKRPRYGSSASSALKMNPDNVMEPSPLPIVRKSTIKATVPSTSTASARRSTRLQQGNVKSQIKVRRSRSHGCGLRLKMSGAASASICCKSKGPAPLTTLRTYNRLRVKLPIAPPQLTFRRCGQRPCPAVRLRTRRETGRWCARRSIYPRHGARVRKGAFANVPVRVQGDDRDTRKAAAATAALAYGHDSHRKGLL